MNNIFKNAYFGKPYKTRDGTKAIYLGIHPKFNTHILTIENKEKEPYWCFYSFKSDGLFDVEKPKEHPFNIVSEWQVDEEELDKLAEEFCDKEYENPTDVNKAQNGLELGYSNLLNCFKAGYRKALEYHGNS